MSIQMQRQPGTALAQLATVADKSPVHKLMTRVTTEFTTTVARAA